MDKKQKKPTINVIAAAAGVSKTTVSRYLNGRFELMKPETAERIRAIIDISHYQPNDAARNLKRKQTNLIGVVVADMTSPFSTALISSIGDYLSNRGYVPLFTHSDNKPEREEKIIELLLSKGVAGLIVNTTSFTNPNLVSVACKDIPIVLCDRLVQGYKFNTVSIDNYSAMHVMVKHLKYQGYTRPVLFTPEWTNNSSRSHRRDAFLQAVQEIFGYDPADDIYKVNSREANSVSAKVDELLNRLSPKDIPAIIGTNTVTTMMTYKALRNADVKIPREIGICGPDDWGWQNNMSWPLLVEPNITTFSVPTKEMGAQAAALLSPASSSTTSRARWTAA